MLANLRHDLRTPLTSIGGFAEAIADGTASGDTAASAARTIAEEAQRLERLVGELGVVERLREGPAALRPEALDATRLIADAAARFEGRADDAGRHGRRAPAAAPGRAPAGLHRRPAGGRADPAEPGRERAVGAARRRPRLAPRGAL